MPPDGDEYDTQSSGCSCTGADQIVVAGSDVVKVLQIVEVLPYGKYSNGQKTQPKSITCGSCRSTDSDHNLDVPNVYQISSNVHEYVGQIKGSGVQN
eukprot:6205226-Pleurochrysis_carterae.AAC.2